MTIAPPPQVVVTPEDLLRMEDAINYELVDGQLVERNMGAESGRVSGRVIILMGSYVLQKSLGETFNSETGYQCFPDAPKKVRRPDASFVRTERVPRDLAVLGHVPVAPDLAVEVVSPNDLADDVEEKVAEYLRAGVPLVWVLYPRTRTVRVHRPRTSPRGPVLDLSVDDAIDGEDVIPGFSCPVKQFFEG
ncbi:MAG: Uma2 family endonuclease [Phycisphaerae bacterium]|nr:Uma2 family endonuclease [Tepidisphaeraceae bacterium]